LFAIQRLEGGMQIADGPVGRTDAVFSLVEMLQPPLLFLAAAAAGLAVGRASAHRTITSVVGGLMIASAGIVYWAWQWSPAVWVSPIQTQPIEIGLGAGFSRNGAPSDWLLSAPDQYEADWGRVMVHQAMAAWHLVFLAGVATAFAGFAVRGRRGRIAVVAGFAVVVLGIVAQAVVTPAGLRGA
jgi:hypothetical protein